MHRIDGAGATADNKFTEGDAATGVAATVVTDDWLNSVQEEIAHVITQTGGTLSKADNTQLWTRLSAWFAKAQTATETLLGQLRVGTQVEVGDGVLDDVAVTPKKLRWGFAISLTSNGYIVFPSWLGGWILQWLTAVHADGKNTAQTFSLPIEFPGSNFVTVGLDNSTVTSRPVIWSASELGRTSVTLHWTFGDVTSNTTSRTCKIITIGK